MICRSRLASPTTNRGTSGWMRHASSSRALIGSSRERLHGIADVFPQIEGDMLQRQLSRLDLRQIEHVVDHGQQRFAGVPDNRQELMLLRGQWGVEQQFAHADHRVQRRADFVAHIGQETALGLVGRFGRFLGRLQCFGRQLLFGDVTRQPERADNPPVLVVQRHLWSSKPR
jgi:hypothetical protein